MNGIHTTVERKKAKLTRIYTNGNLPLSKNGVDITSVTRTNNNANNINNLRINFCFKWLGDMGFMPGALVQFLPEPNGVTFILCDKNIQMYSDLDLRTKEKGGTLMQVNKIQKGSQLCVSGSRLDDTGLIFGDTLIVRYEYGFIRMRKLSCNSTKLTTAHVIGSWLSETGFVPDAVLTVHSSPGLITCTLHENSAKRTAELVKYVRENKLKLIQVQKMKHKHSIRQWIDIPSQCLDKAGFAANDLLFAVYDYGTLKLQKPNFSALGF